jgi:hypothetical protein
MASVSQYAKRLFHKTLFDGTGAAQQAREQCALKSKWSRLKPVSIKGLQCIWPEQASILKICMLILYEVCTRVIITFHAVFFRTKEAFILH